MTRFLFMLNEMYTAIAAAAAAGSFTALLVSRGNTAATIVTYFLIGQLSAFYFTVPIADGWLGFGPDAYGWIGFLIGLTGILFWGGVLSLFQGLRDDPKGTIAWALSFWKGKAG